MASFFSLFFIVVFFKVFAQDVCYWPRDVRPEKVPENCADIFSPGKDIEGVYELKVNGLEYEANCIPDPVYGPAWTLIQRRMDGSVDFFRYFEEYENGFGNKNGEYWLGLKYIFAITNSENFELWVQMVNYDEEYRFARYERFFLSNASEQYALNVYDYFGNAGDSFGNCHNGMKFYTKDKDTTKKCSSFFIGAWWMRNCFNSHLNGKYLQHTKKNKSGVKWLSFTGTNNSLKYAHMAIRPSKYS